MHPIPLAAAAVVFTAAITSWSAAGPAAGDPVPPGAAMPVHEPILPAGHPALPAGDHFYTAERCALCHSVSPQAQAMVSATGDDVSPHGLWQATMMANSFRDPYWRAQVSKEVAADPDHADATQALCLTCHGPAAHHQARLEEQPSPGVFASYADPLAQDGVTCTVCHQTQPEGLGAAHTFNGNLPITATGEIYGPYEDPFHMPMLMHTGYTATHGPHIRDSALCGSCHTLHTQHAVDAAPFPEQTPYLEWRNSAFTTEGGATETAKSCQDCHMVELGATRIARNPRGFDFNIPLRDPYRGHTFIGGNAFMLTMLKDHAEELGVTATPAALERSIRATQRFLAQETAAVAVEGLQVSDGHLEFGVRVVNKTGHKLPTGYPARRAWLRVQVRAGRQVVFESGGVAEDGSIVGLVEPRRNPHHAVIERPDQVQVFECVPVDAAGEPTTYLTRMAAMGKDNRLLPSGWRADGPHADETAPVGTADDADFAGGGDRVAFRVPVDGAGEGLVVVAWLLYQPVPPSWVTALREVDTDEARAFVAMYDAADKAPDTLAVDVGVLR